MNAQTVESTPSEVTTIFEKAIQLSIMERLALAKLLLDSVLTDETNDETDWSAISLNSFQRDWNNPEDAIYDDWRKLYGVPTG